ncbi:MAG: DUF3341 domain-containing protein [Chitinophagales bacterium]|nr:DUF3341 domain-containing protein [Bacteroidota bacterium]MCB9044363.1 DUF3341 domain-containing protein [Chitinophagales bacterium]
MAYRYLLGLFDDEVPLLDAVGKLRHDGWHIHDVLTPFPVHGLDPVLGLKETRLHTAGFVFGATGTAFALLAMTYISTVDWPNVFGGKPYFSLPAFIPIAFEVTVLFASVGMVITYYLRNRLSVFAHPEILEPRTSNDRFAIVFDLGKYNDDAGKLEEALLRMGAVEVKVREMNQRQRSHNEQSA